ncbi:MAG: hypothetical protein HKN30_14355 [Sulfitobacter sp.]|nr:hypothetical protein [Sulfitobacter sp.]
MKILIPMLIGVLVLTGCGNNDDRILFDGHYYRTKVKKVDGQIDVFTVQIRDVSQSLEGARQAGRFAGTEYCVENYGSSDIKWEVGPDTPDAELQIVDNRLIFSGVCPST